LNQRKRLILAVMVAIAAAPAFASGFGFCEQEAKASAQGGAWVAHADDASANWYNPAALAQLTSHEVQLGINDLEVDAFPMQLDFDDATANGSPADGVINGTYTSSALLAGVTAKYRF
jgi:long-subunit fatty acid transport protein